MVPSSRELQIINSPNTVVIDPYNPFDKAQYLPNGQRVCNTDDLLVFNDLGINEQKLVRTEIRRQEKVNNDYHDGKSSNRN